MDADHHLLGHFAPAPGEAPSAPPAPPSSFARFRTRLARRLRRILRRPDASEVEEWHGDAGLLEWSRSEGAHLRILAAHPSWPRQSRGPFFAVHGSTEDGDPLTLIDAWVNRVPMLGGTLGVTASKMVVGEHISPNTAWDRLVVSTAHLHEWLPDTGLSRDPPILGEHGVDSWTIKWNAQPSIPVQLNDAALEFSMRMDTEAELAPVSSIRTALDAMFTPSSAMTLDELERAFVDPLLALMMFAADRPDAITSERVIVQGTSTRGVVLHRGRVVESRQWQPDAAFLFRAEDLNDFERAVGLWFETFGRFEHAIRNFADSISDGRTYTPDRLIKIATALESYHRALGNPRGHLADRMKALRTRGGLAEATTGCSDDNLELLEASRNWYAHLGRLPQGITRQMVEDNLLPSTRRAEALMQSCLLRDIDVSVADAERLFAEHYHGWPIPS